MKQGPRKALHRAALPHYTQGLLQYTRGGLGREQHGVGLGKTSSHRCCRPCSVCCRPSRRGGEGECGAADRLAPGCGRVWPAKAVDRRQSCCIEILQPARPINSSYLDLQLFVDPGLVPHTALLPLTAQSPRFHGPLRLPRTKWLRPLGRVTRRMRLGLIAACRANAVSRRANSRSVLPPGISPSCGRVCMAH